MARPPASGLTDAELRIMQIVWERGEATVGDVCERLRPKPARNSVQTMLGILERKRYVRHRVEGRTFVYRPIVEKRDAGLKAIRKVLTTFYPGSRGALMLRLLNEEDAHPNQLKRLRRMIDESDAD